MAMNQGVKQAKLPGQSKRFLNAAGIHQNAAPVFPRSAENLRWRVFWRALLPALSRVCPLRIVIFGSVPTILFTFVFS